MNKYLELMRVQQWTKNLFVFLGVFFAGQIFSISFLDATKVFIAFCLASSITYIINDLRDLKNDALHPKKKNRPLASGKIKVRDAKIMIAIFALLIFAATFFIKPIAAGIMVFYILFNIIYTLVLKQIVLIDVFSIAFSFILRVFAGTYGIGIEASSWLLVTIIALSLFLGFGKRLNEKKFVAEKHREVLKQYPEQFLNQLTLVSGTLSIAFYSLYITETNANVMNIATIPLVIFGFFRYFYIMQVEGRGGDPTEEMVKDRYILSTVILWGILLFINLNI